MAGIQMTGYSPQSFSSQKSRNFSIRRIRYTPTRMAIHDRSILDVSHSSISGPKAREGRDGFGRRFARRANCGITIAEPLRSHKIGRGASVNEHRAFTCGVTIGHSQALRRSINPPSSRAPVFVIAAVHSNGRPAINCGGPFGKLRKEVKFIPTYIATVTPTRSRIDPVGNGSIFRIIVRRTGGVVASPFFLLPPFLVIGHLRFTGPRGFGCRSI